MNKDKKAMYDLITNYFCYCEENGHCEFEMWCEGNIDNDGQRKLFDIINNHVESIADLLFN